MRLSLPTLLTLLSALSVGLALLLRWGVMTAGDRALFAAIALVLLAIGLVRLRRRQ